MFGNKKPKKKETVIKREITITLQYDLAIGKVNLNEIVYRLKEVRDPLMLRILEEILKSYDNLISERLSQTKIYLNVARNLSQLLSYVIR